MSIQTTRFDEVWNSLEPEVRGDLERMYHRLSVIMNEAQLNGVKRPVAFELINQRFWELWKTIGRDEGDRKQQRAEEKRNHENIPFFSLAHQRRHQEKKVGQA